MSCGRLVYRPQIRLNNILAVVLFLLSSAGLAQQKKDAFEFEASAINDFGYNISGGLKQGGVCLGNVNLMATFNTEQAQLWKGGTLFIHVMHNYGNPLSDYVGDFQMTSNIEAKLSIRLYQFWYQQQIGNLYITIGQHDLNSEFAITEFGSIFINSSFGIQPDISANVPVSIFPLTSLSGIVKWDISDKFKLLAGVYDGDPGDEGSNPHSLNWELNEKEGLMTIYELQSKLIKNSLITGVYKIGVWHHTADLASHSKNIGYKNNQGVYFITDHMIITKGSKKQGLGIFTQLGATLKDCNSVDFYGGVGIQYLGLIPGREKDHFGIAFGHASFCPALGGENLVDPLSRETAIEFTYRLMMNSHLSLQPDLQYVINPGGSTVVENALVGTIRLNMEF